MIWKFMLLIFVFFYCKINVSSQKTSHCTYSSLNLVRVIPQNEDHIRALAELPRFRWIWIQPWINATQPLAPAIFAARAETAIFLVNYCRNLGMHADIVITDVQRDIIQLSRNVSEYGRPVFKFTDHPSKFSLNHYHPWSEIYAFMHELQQSYPELCSVLSIGETSERRPMKILKISAPGKPAGGKKGIFIDATIHAREWIATSVATHLMYKLTVEYSRSEEIRKLVHDTTWFILPIVNLDGYIYTWEHDRYWRKSRSVNPSCTSSVRFNDATCYCRGVDMNRNWDSHWNTSDSCVHPCCNTFPGRQPMSEPEVQNVARFLTNNQAYIDAYVSLHNYGQVWMYPYAHTKKYPPQATRLHELAELAVEALNNVYGSNYTFASAGARMGHSGSSMDWVIDNTNISTAYLVEVRPKSKGDFCLDESEIVPTSEEVFAGIKVVARYVGGALNLSGKYDKYFRDLQAQQSRAASPLFTSLHFVLLFAALFLLLNLFKLL